MDNNLKKYKIRKIVFGIAKFLSMTFSLVLLELVISDNLQAILWWGAIEFLFLGLVAFLTSANRINNPKIKRGLFIEKVIFTSVGAGLLIADSFLFIKELLVSFMLILSVGLGFIAIVLYRYWIEPYNYK